MKLIKPVMRPLRLVGAAQGESFVSLVEGKACGARRNGRDESSPAVGHEPSPAGLKGSRPLTMAGVIAQVPPHIVPIMAAAVSRS